MKIESSAFKDGENIPPKYTADGENINPSLIISEIPEKAKTLVLICDDPDAKRVCGYTWIHWVLFDIPVDKSVVNIPEDSSIGKHGESSYGKSSYGGPNPPSGTGIHNYHFKIYALNKKLELPEMTSLKNIENTMQDYILEKAELVGIYSKY